MPDVNQQSKVTRTGQHTREDINKIQRDDKARDNIKAAYSGNENNGPAKDPKSEQEHQHSSNVKSRNTLKSRDRVPKR